MHKLFQLPLSGNTCLALNQAVCNPIIVWPQNLDDISVANVLRDVDICKQILMTLDTQYKNIFSPK